MYKKVALSKVEKLKTTIFPTGHLISLVNIPHVQKWLPFGKMHERLVIVEFKTGELIRIFINIRVIYDFCMAAFAYVYEIFTVTQQQFAVTKSNKKITEQACGRFCFLSFIHLI